MAQHKENDFVIPTLVTIYQMGGIATMEKIKDEICKYIRLTEDDWKPYPSRSKHEPRYRQVVGNLISHKNQDLFQYICIMPEENSTGTVTYQYLLNENGRKLVESLEDDENGVPILLSEEVKLNGQNENEGLSLNQNDDSVDAQVAFSNDGLEKEQDGPIISLNDQKVVDAVNGSKINRKDITNTSSYSTILQINDYKCKYGLLVGEKHKSFVKEDGTQFMVVHHLIPMKASVDFFPRNLDTPSNLAVLCPNCHETVHHGSKVEKTKILKVLYDNMIEQINEEEMFISFEELIEKYY